MTESDWTSTGYWCEWPGCPNEAWYRMSAQWSIFDWDHVLVCLDHLNGARESFARRLVDGRAPFDVVDMTLDIPDPH